MLKKPTVLSYTTILFVLVVSIAMPPLHSTDTAAAVSGEPFSPTSEPSVEDWNTLVGVGTVFYYPPDWKARPYQAQGGVRDGATYEFVWTDARGVAARIEVLEIVERSSRVRALTSELSYWQQHGPERGYEVTQATVRDWPTWWIDGGGTEAEMVWVDAGERVYRFRLRCRAEAREEGVRVLRRMLATLEVTEVDWSRAAGPPSVPSGGRATSGVELAPAALSWTGLVVSMGSDPTLATHSDEMWTPASTLYCSSGEQQTYEKTYLHANVELMGYLPVVLRNWPPVLPMKAFAGIHLGNHEVGDWTDEELALIDGDGGGVWPRVIVVQSKQVWNV